MGEKNEKTIEDLEKNIKKIKFFLKEKVIQDQDERIRKLEVKQRQHELNMDSVIEKLFWVICAFITGIYIWACIILAQYIPTRVEYYDSGFPTIETIIVIYFFVMTCTFTYFILYKFYRVIIE